MLEKKSSSFIEALQIIQKSLDAMKIEWVLVGSLSLYLQGIEVEPHDIDILTTKEGASKCQELWNEYTIKPIEWSRSPEFQSYFGKFRIANMLVEVMGELKVKQAGQWESLTHHLKEPKRIKIHDIQIPVSSLEEQLIGYTKSPRDKDNKTAILIKQLLKYGEKKEGN